MRHDNEEWCKIWTGIDWSVQNWHETFDKFWSEHSKISIICTLMGCFWPKNIIFELRKFRGVMFNDTQNWCKVWRTTDLRFQKWHGKLGKSSPEHSKISKICTLISCFWPKYKRFELKKYRGVMFDGTEHWCKIWIKNWLAHSKVTGGIWQIFIRARLKV